MIPCPFCKSTNVFPYGRADGGVAILCDDCHAMGPHADDDNNAIVAWNRRPSPPQDGKRELEEAPLVSLALAADPGGRITELSASDLVEGLREKLRTALRPYLHDNITQDAVHNAIEEIVDIVRPGEVLDCKTTLGTPIGHLFVDDWHDDNRSRCARCGILETDYWQPLPAPPEETP